MKRLLFFLVGIETILFIILAIKYNKLNDSFLQQCEMVSKSEWGKYLVEDEDCIWWHKSEDYVVEKLPTPLWYGEVKIKDDGEWTPPPYERYLSKVKDTKDTITIHSYRWYNPFSNRTRIEVIFEKVDSGWVATSCLEYDPNEVDF